MWVGPALTAVVIAIAGWWTHRQVEGAVKVALAGQLQTLLEADVASLRIWLAGQRADAAVLADDRRIRVPVVQLVEIANRPDAVSVTADLLTAPALADLRQHLRPWFETHGVQGFVVIDRSGLLLAADNDMGVGDSQLAQGFQQVLAPVFDGETVFIPPFKSLLVQEDIDGTPRAGVPVMFGATPIRDDRGEILAALCLRIRPEKDFTEILRAARAGESGETYAFDRLGVLITNSRFDNDLKRLGLLSDDDQTRSLLNIEIRDPGVDMTMGLRPTVRRAELPLTRMAAAAVAGESGVDIDGYRDYRGVPVVGAWTWLIELVKSFDEPFLECAQVESDSMRAGITLAEWFSEEAARVYRLSTRQISCMLQTSGYRQAPIHCTNFSSRANCDWPLRWEIAA